MINQSRASVAAVLTMCQGMHDGLRKTREIMYDPISLLSLFFSVFRWTLLCRLHWVCSCTWSLCIGMLQ